MVSTVGEVSQTSNIASGSYATASAACPAGTVRVGGGAAAWSSRTDGDYRAVLVESYPEGATSWSARAQASGAINQPGGGSTRILRVTAYVICL